MSEESKDEMQKQMEELITEQVLGPHGWVFNGENLLGFSFLNSRNFKLEHFSANRLYVHLPNGYVFTGDINVVLFGSIITIGLNEKAFGLGDMKYTRCFNDPEYIVKIEHKLGKFSEAGVNKKDFTGYLQIAFDILIDKVTGLIRDNITAIPQAKMIDNPLTHKTVKLQFYKNADKSQGDNQGI